MDPRSVIEAFVQAWNRMDFDAVIEALDERIIYHNIPMQALEGRNAVRVYLKSAWRFESVDWQILNIACNGNIVLTERVDDFVINGHNVSLPVMGAFELYDSKIVAWRDYFDLASYRTQMQAASGASSDNNQNIVREKL